MTRLFEYLKKHFEELIGFVTGGGVGVYHGGFFDDWVRPLLLSALCALIGLLVTHFGKRLLKKLGV